MKINNSTLLRAKGNKTDAQLVQDLAEKQEIQNFTDNLKNKNDLSDDEKFFIERQLQTRNHTLNIRFNDAEWSELERLSSSLNMKKSSYVRESAFSRTAFYINKEDMKNLVRQIQGIGVNINQIAHHVNNSNSIYSSDIIEMKEKVNQLWQLLTSIQSKVQQVHQSDTLLTRLRPTTVNMLNLSCARQEREQQSSLKISEKDSVQEEIQF